MMKPWTKFINFCIGRLEPGNDEIDKAIKNIEENKPSLVLARLIASDLMAKGVAVYSSIPWKSADSVLYLERDSKASKTPEPGFSYRHQTLNSVFDLEGKTYKIRAQWSDYTAAGRPWTITVEANDVDFNEAEKEIIKDGLAKGLQFEKERSALTKDRDKQAKAIEAIEAFTGIGKLANQDGLPLRETEHEDEDSLKPLPGPSVDDFFSLNAGRR